MKRTANWSGKFELGSAVAMNMARFHTGFPKVALATQGAQGFGFSADGIGGVTSCGAAINSMKRAGGWYRLDRTDRSKGGPTLLARPIADIVVPPGPRLTWPL